MMDPVSLIVAITGLVEAVGKVLAPLLAGWLLPQPKFMQRGGADETKKG